MHDLSNAGSGHGPGPGFETGAKSGAGSDAGSGAGSGSGPAMPAFGFLAWLEQTRVALPLKGVEARFEVVGEVAHVEIDQIYHQNAAVPLDCVYTFPLPAGAAVYRCEFHCNERSIAARVEKQVDAREIYGRAKSAGRRAMLVEGVRENLFTLSLANVQPDDLIVVRLAYLQTLERIGNENRLRIPFCPGIRYLPGQPLLRPNRGTGGVDDTDQVPDASRISPPRIDRLHRDAAYVSVVGTLQRRAATCERFESPSHPVKVQTEENRALIELAGHDAVPDQDFLLSWQECGVEEFRPRVWAQTHEGWRYRMVELVSPTLPARSKAGKLSKLWKSLAGHNAGPAGSSMERDVYFLLDRSGSMAGSKWLQACQALGECARTMDPQDRLAVTLFSHACSDYAEAPLPVREFLAQNPIHTLQQQGVDGGTNLVAGLEHVVRLVQTHSAGRRATLVILTDGQVGNDLAVVAALAPVPKLVVHTFGIDTTVNDALLARIARRQRGRAVFLRPDEDVVAAVRKLGELLRSPVVVDWQIPEGWESPDGPLPDLYAGEKLLAIFRAPESTAMDSPWFLEGCDAAGAAVRLAPDEETMSGPWLGRLWARRRLLHLAENSATAFASSDSPAGMHAAMFGRGSRAPEPGEELARLAKQFNLLAPGMAFVAYDTKENVAVANDEVVQPSLNPHLWELQAARSIGELQANDQSSVDVARYCLTANLQIPPGIPPEIPNVRKRERRSMTPLPEMISDGLRKIFRPTMGSDEVEQFIQQELAKLPVFQTDTGKDLLRVLDDWLRRPGLDVAVSIKQLRSLLKSAGAFRSKSWGPADADQWKPLVQGLLRVVGEVGPVADAVRQVIAKHELPGLEAALD